MSKKTHLHSLISCLLTMFLLLSLALTAHADGLPEPTSQFYVLDEAGVLGPAAEAKIVSENQALFALTGAEIAVVCVDTTGTADIADYAYDLFNKWGIGSTQRNNGVLILLSIGEDDYWVLQGQGLEETLTSGMLKLWNNDYLEPHFAKKQYEDGVLALFDAIVAHLETMYSVDIESWDGAPGEFTPKDAAPAEKDGDGSSVFMTVLIVIIVILLILLILNASSGGGSGHRHTRTIIHTPVIVRPPRSGYYPGSSYRPRGGSSFGGSSHGGISGGRPGSSRGGFSGGSPGGSRGGFSGGGGGRSRGGGAGRR